MKTAGMKISAAADWVVDVLVPNLLMTVIAATWLGTTVLLFVVAPWWAGAAELALGVPFAVATSNAIADV